MEKRSLDRIPSSLPVRLTANGQNWTGTCINLSEEGALVKLQTRWGGAIELEFELDPALGRGTEIRAAHVVRESSPDQHGAFLAIRFPLPATDLIEVSSKHHGELSERD